ncbi:unnamed protein product [Gordionus sp. m RMFG-2023]
MSEVLKKQLPVSDGYLIFNEEEYYENSRPFESKDIEKLANQVHKTKKAYDRAERIFNAMREEFVHQSHDKKHYVSSLNNNGERVSHYSNYSSSKNTSKRVSKTKKTFKAVYHSNYSEDTEPNKNRKATSHRRRVLTYSNDSSSKNSSRRVSKTKKHFKKAVYSGNYSGNPDYSRYSEINESNKNPKVKVDSNYDDNGRNLRPFKRKKNKGKRIRLLNDLPLNETRIRSNPRRPKILKSNMSLDNNKGDFDGKTKNDSQNRRRILTKGNSTSKYDSQNRRRNSMKGNLTSKKPLLNSSIKYMMEQHNNVSVAKNSKKVGINTSKTAADDKIKISNFKNGSEVKKPTNKPFAENKSSTITGPSISKKRAKRSINLLVENDMDVEDISNDIAYLDKHKMDKDALSKASVGALKSEKMEFADDQMDSKDDDNWPDLGKKWGRKKLKYSSSFDSKKSVSSNARRNKKKSGRTRKKEITEEDREDDYDDEDDDDSEMEKAAMCPRRRSMNKKGKKWRSYSKDYDDTKEDEDDDYEDDDEDDDDYENPLGMPRAEKLTGIKESNETAITVGTNSTINTIAKATSMTSTPVRQPTGPPIIATNKKGKSKSKSSLNLGLKKGGSVSSNSNTVLNNPLKAAALEERRIIEDSLGDKWENEEMHGRPLYDPAPINGDDDDDDDDDDDEDDIAKMRNGMAGNLKEKERSLATLREKLGEKDDLLESAEEVVKRKTRANEKEVNSRNMPSGPPANRPEGPLKYESTSTEVIKAKVASQNSYNDNKENIIKQIDNDFVVRRSMAVPLESSKSNLEFPFPETLKISDQKWLGDFKGDKNIGSWDKINDMDDDDDDDDDDNDTLISNKEAEGKDMHLKSAWARIKRSPKKDKEYSSEEEDLDDMLEDTHSPLAAELRDARNLESEMDIDDYEDDKDVVSQRRAKRDTAIRYTRDLGRNTELAYFAEDEPIKSEVSHGSLKGYHKRSRAMESHGGFKRDGRKGSSNRVPGYLVYRIMHSPRYLAFSRRHHNKPGIQANKKKKLKNYNRERVIERSRKVTKRRAIPSAHFDDPDSWIILRSKDSRSKKVKRGTTEELQDILKKAQRKGESDDDSSNPEDGILDDNDDDGDDLTENGSIWVVPDDSITIYS